MINAPINQTINLCLETLNFKMKYCNLQGKANMIQQKVRDYKQIETANKQNNNLPFLALCCVLDSDRFDIWQEKFVNS